MPMTAADLIEEYGEKEETYQILLHGGKRVTVRNILDMQTIAQIERRSSQISRASDNNTVPAGWKPFMPITPEVARIVAEFESLLVEPTFTPIEAMNFCKKAGPTAAFIHMQIVHQAARCVPERESEIIDDLKNDLAPMSSGDASSSSAETPSTNIPAASTKTTGKTQGS